MSKTLTLPSGKTAVLRNGKGYDLLQAQMKSLVYSYGKTGR